MNDQAPLAFAAITLVLSMATIVGMFVIESTRLALDRPSLALLSPTVGLAAWVIAGYWCARFDVPLRFAGPVIVGISTVASGIGLLHSRRFSLRSSAWKSPTTLLVLPSLLTLVMFFVPVSRFGFDYTAFGNTDWTFYLINAQSLFERGFAFPTQVPETNLNLPLGAAVQIWQAGRQGTEVLVAEIMGALVLNVHAAYLVLLVIAQVLLVTNATFIAWSVLRRVVPSVLAGIAVMLSPLLAYAFTLQLLPQNLGITLLEANVPVALSLLQRPSNGLRLSDLLLPAMLIATQLLVYPELFPFIGLAVGLRVFINAFSAKSVRPLRQLVWPLAPIALGAVVLIAPGAYNALHWIVLGIASTAPPSGGGGKLAGFPSFLGPEGQLDFWGLHEVGAALPPYGVAIVMLAFAMILLLCLIIAMVDMAKGGNAAALITLPMLLLALRLFSTEADFGCFKLAMYGQPFAILTLWTWAFSRSRPA